MSTERSGSAHRAIWSIPDGATGNSARASEFNGYRIVRRTVTIAADRAEIVSYFDDASKLNRILVDVGRVEDLSSGTRTWTLKSGGNCVQLETISVKSQPYIARVWQTIDGAKHDAQIEINFRDAPADRGQEVQLRMAYKQIWGGAGDLVAKLQGIDANSAVRVALKHLKMLLETGEIATSENRRVS
ncbi:hypothetical protein [Ketogulonicigenium vulgare]|uniref:SRPBCC family protein n=1 Tax=Ketogulonicigenium vulgare TaxID=92945 RepID=UPI0023591B7B|nr:hypothetical protein [Ketogulonicigenium vulgare]